MQLDSFVPYSYTFGEQASDENPKAEEESQRDEENREEDGPEVYWEESPRYLIAYGKTVAEFQGRLNRFFSAGFIPCEKQPIWPSDGNFYWLLENPERVNIEWYES